MAALRKLLVDKMEKVNAKGIVSSKIRERSGGSVGNHAYQARKLWYCSSVEIVHKKK